MTAHAPRSGRWLVLADEEPAAVRLESYAERLARELRSLGQEAVVVHSRRGSLPPRTRPGVHTVEPVPIPLPLGESNRLLARAVRLQRVLGEIARGADGPFDAVLAEGALGALVGPPLAARLGLPLVLVLLDCEVERRGNQLSREQLYLAELEHWGAARATVALVPDEATAAAVKRHYQVEATVVPVPTSATAVSSRRGSLLRRLGLPSRYALVLAEELGDREQRALLEGPREIPVLCAGADLWFRGADPGSTPEVRARGRTRGPALGSLLAACELVVAFDRRPERRADATRIAPRFAFAQGSVPRDAFEQATESARRVQPPDLTAPLRGLVLRVLSAPAKASREPALL